MRPGGGSDSIYCERLCSIEYIIVFCCLRQTATQPESGSAQGSSRVFLPLLPSAACGGVGSKFIQILDILDMKTELTSVMIRYYIK